MKFEDIEVGQAYRLITSDYLVLAKDPENKFVFARDLNADRSVAFGPWTYDHFNIAKKPEWEKDKEYTSPVTKTVVKCLHVFQNGDGFLFWTTSGIPKTFRAEASKRPDYTEVS